MTAPPPALSIVIPAYNEEQRLSRTLDAIRAWLDVRKMDAEVIVVADGSRDATPQLVQACAATWPALRLIMNDHNHGKGYTVRRGMLEARGEIALFTDADLSAPIDEAEKLLAALRNADVAIGSRAVDRGLIEVHQSRSREWAGLSFNLAVRLLTGLPYRDTQCGFKAFRRERARIIFEQQRIEGFGFDAEILFLAGRYGLTISEVPVRWANDPRSKVRVLRDGTRMVLDLFLIRWNALAGRYPVPPKS